MKPKRLFVLSINSGCASAAALAKFASLLGIDSETFLISHALLEPPRDLSELLSHGGILAVERNCLGTCLSFGWFGDLVTHLRFVLVFDCGPDDSHSTDLHWLTSGALSSVITLTAGTRELAVNSDVQFSRFAVSGKSCIFETEALAAFRRSECNEDLEIYLSVDDNPVFVSTRRGNATVFLLAGSELINIDLPVRPETSLRPWYVPLIAMSMFLQSAFGDWCWTAPVTGATFVVDDPYLKRRYGFVHYETLIPVLERTRGALTIAFIPYNYRRSDLKTVELLRRHTDRFSICIHGCDHTGGEFASLDEEWLAGTVTCALERMKLHTNRTQMPFDNVMVFPQGRFSTKAIGALKAYGIAAAVNTTPWPEDQMEYPLTIRDLLEVAVTRYESFPIFRRRYPLDLFDFAFDAMFQKPIFAVEHHGFFRQGYTTLAQVVNDISKLGSKVEWMPLGRAVRSSCVLKRTSDSQFTLRHFAPDLRFRNPSQTSLTLSIEKPEQDGHVEAVLVGGQKVPFEVHSGFLKYAACIEPGGELNAAVLYRQPPRASRSLSFKYRIAASTRRLLSDLRDNRLARSERALSFAEKIKSAVLRQSLWIPKEAAENGRRWTAGQ